MADLLIIADDFTGALDTGVQFAKRGADTCVITDSHIRFRDMEHQPEVFVLDAETRHMKPEDAYRVVADAVKNARESNIPCIYKKTDSALRGNIGAELAALCDEAGGTVHFIPAFPQIGRITRNGILYVDGVPVGESVFGQDPFEPVCASDVREIIALQTDIAVTRLGQEEQLPASFPKGIIFYDADTEERIDAVTEKLKERGELHVCAGCAGFASRLARVLGYTKRESDMPQLQPGLFVACGSVNPITVRQLETAQAAGYPRIHLGVEAKFDPGWPDTEAAGREIERWKSLCREHGVCIIDSNDEPGSRETANYMREHRISMEQVRVKIAHSIGSIVKQALDSGWNAALLITGGDTLMGFLQQIGRCVLTPVCELLPGVVLSSFEYGGQTRYVISKSGGFGSENLIEELLNILEKERKPYADTI